MAGRDYYPPLSAFSTGLRGRCPRCGGGRLYQGFLTVAPRCEVCGLDFSGIDTGDGPAVFIVLIVGAVIAAAALIVEVNYQPAYWVHALLWLPPAIGLPLILLRPFKGVLLALHYKHQAEEGRMAE